MRQLRVIQEARACQICDKGLPLGPRPLVQGSGVSRVLIIGQAPGSVAHKTGVPWDDASGRRLRAWLGVTDGQFYDPGVMALMPMGFCYPGTGTGGDLPPRAECAPEWHPRMLRAFKGVGLTVIIGRYAMDEYASRAYGTVTEAVRDYAGLMPERVVLPHPSPRNNIWLKKNPWFGGEVLPRLRARVSDLIA